MQVFTIFLALHLFANTPTAEPIRQLIRSNMEQVKACYNEYIAEKQKEGNVQEARGHLTMSWDIDPSGKAYNFKEVKTSFTDKQVFACISAKMLTWKFQVPAKNKVTSVSFPFVFSIKE